MPTVKDVLDAFDSFGDKVVQPMALALKIERMGFDSDAVTSAINEAMKAGQLIETEAGGIRRSGLQDVGYSQAHMEALNGVAATGPEFQGAVTSLPIGKSLSDNDRSS